MVAFTTVSAIPPSGNVSRNLSHVVHDHRGMFPMNRATMAMTDKLTRHPEARSICNNMLIRAWSRLPKIAPLRHSG